MSHKRRRTATSEVIGLPDDEQELVEMLQDLESLHAQAQKYYRHLDVQRMLVKDKLKRMRIDRTAISVTDHALIRYLERVKGMDLEPVRQEMLGHVPEGTGFDKVPEIIDMEDLKLSLVLRDSLIITIKPIGDNNA